MLIILEGPDGVGKTTLAERLVTYLCAKFPSDRVELIHRGPPTMHPLDEYAVPLLDYHPGTGRHLVLDRWHWGERIYPKYLARRSKMTSDIFTYIEMLIVQKGGFVVNLRHPLERLLERVSQRGDDLIRPEWLEAISWDYRTLGHQSLTGVSGLHDESPTVDTIVDYARRLERDATPLAALTTPVTTTRHGASMILLGDVRNCLGGRKCTHKMCLHPANGTAFMPYPATSGAYLLRALQIKRGDRIVIANAADDDMPSLIWDKYDRPPIVALGAVAHKTLKINGLRHAVAPHPQFVRRFHYVADVEYGQLIRSLADGDERNELKWRPTPSRERTVGLSTHTS